MTKSSPRVSQLIDKVESVTPSACWLVGPGWYVLSDPAEERRAALIPQQLRRLGGSVDFRSLTRDNEKLVDAHS